MYTPSTFTLSIILFCTLQVLLVQSQPKNGRPPFPHGNKPNAFKNQPPKVGNKNPGPKKSEPQNLKSSASALDPGKEPHELLKRPPPGSLPSSDLKYHDGSSKSSPASKHSKHPHGHIGANPHGPSNQKQKHPPMGQKPGSNDRHKINADLDTSKESAEISTSIVQTPQNLSKLIEELLEPPKESISVEAKSHHEKHIHHSKGHKGNTDKNSNHMQKHLKNVKDSSKDKPDRSGLSPNRFESKSHPGPSISAHSKSTHTSGHNSKTGSDKTEIVKSSKETSKNTQESHPTTEKAASWLANLNKLQEDSKKHIKAEKSSDQSHSTNKEPTKVEPKINFQNSQEISKNSQEANPTVKSVFSWLANLNKLQEDSQKRPKTDQSDSPNKEHFKVESQLNSKSSFQTVENNYNSDLKKTETKYQSSNNAADNDKRKTHNNFQPKPLNPSWSNSPSSKQLDNQIPKGISAFSDNKKLESISYPKFETYSDQNSEQETKETFDISQLFSNPEPEPPLPKFEALVAPALKPSLNFRDKPLPKNPSDQKPQWQPNFKKDPEQNPSTSKYISDTPEWKSFVASLLKKPAPTAPPKAEKFQVPKYQPVFRNSQEDLNHPTLDEIEAAPLPVFFQPTTKYPKVIIPKVEPMWRPFTEEERLDIENARRDSIDYDKNDALLDNAVQSFEQGLKGRGYAGDDEDLEHELDSEELDEGEKQAEQELYKDLKDYLGDEAKEPPKKWWQKIPFLHSSVNCKFKLVRCITISTFLQLLLKVFNLLLFYDDKLSFLD